MTSTGSKFTAFIRFFLSAWPALVASLLVPVALMFSPGATVVVRALGALGALLAGAVLVVALAVRTFDRAVRSVRRDPSSANEWLEDHNVPMAFLFDRDGQPVATVYPGWEDVAREHLRLAAVDGVDTTAMRPDAQVAEWLEAHSYQLRRVRLLWAETIGAMLGAERCTTCGAIADRGCNGEASCASCACKRCSDREPITRLPWTDQAALLARAMHEADIAAQAVERFVERLRGTNGADPTAAAAHDGKGPHGAN